MAKKNKKGFDIHGLTSNRLKGKKKCCFCGEELDEYGGNNPWPFKVKGRCCSYCDNHFVIPLRGRIMMLQRKSQLAEQQ